MNSNFEISFGRQSLDPGVLLEMYESDELFNEGLLSFEYPLYHAASGENLSRAALSSLGELVVKRIEKQTGPIISTAARRLPIPSRRFTQPSRRLPRVQREISVPAFASATNDEGTWTRRGDQIIVLNV